MSVKPSDKSAMSPKVLEQQNTSKLKLVFRGTSFHLQVQF